MYILFILDKVANVFLMNAVTAVFLIVFYFYNNTSCLVK